MMNTLLYLVYALISIANISYASPGCLVAKGPLGTLDYKEWRVVRNCTCDCENSYTILRGGLCSGCKHRHTLIPLNTKHNYIDMQTVVQNVHLNQLKKARWKEITAKMK